MARHGENIRKRKDGRWEGRYGVYCEEKGKKKYISVYGRSYEEVKKKLTTNKNLLNSQQRRNNERIRDHQPQSDILFMDAAAEWLAQVRQEQKPSTYVKYSLICRNHLEKAFQEMPLFGVTDALARERLSPVLSESLQKSIYCVLNRILKYASLQYGLALRQLKAPTPGIRNKPAKALTDREQTKLLESLYHKMDRYKLAVLLCLHTGLRLGELCALKWSDVDRENGILAVNRTVQRLYIEGHPTKTVLLENEPKSEHSQREIPLPSRMAELLYLFFNEKPYVFGGDKPLEPRTMQNHFKKILDEAGVSDKNFHILRHTFATNCVEGGADVKSLSEMLGHSGIQITLDRYVHPSMESKRRYVNDLSGFYGRICGQICGQAS